MLEFAGCKINLGLSVTGKRADGYHEIKSVMYPLPFYDVVEIIASTEFSFQTSGLAIDGQADDNLVVKAYRLLQAAYDLPPVSIHLHKEIYMGAGLGGGSSDAVAALRLLNALFDLKLTTDELEAYAAQLGTDCPFFVRQVPALASGTGTHLQPVSLSLSTYHVLLVKPDLHISTREAYQGLSHYSDGFSPEEVQQQPVYRWKELLMNDFESSLFEKYPGLGDVKEQLYQHGALYASMTGSGSALYGLFAHKPEKLPLPFAQKVLSL